MIEIISLNESDVGLWVEYCPLKGEHEMGRILSWNDKYIFVVFKCGGDWDNFRDYTGEAVDPEDLILFVTERKSDNE